MKSIVRPALIAAAVVMAISVASVSYARTKSAPTVSKAEASEIVGYELAGRYPAWARSLVDPRQVGEAVTRALEGRKPTMSQSKAESVARAFNAEFRTLGKQHYEQASANNKKAGTAYLAKNKRQPGWRTTSNGLQYKIISQGKGPRPKGTDTVQVDYTGSFVDGQTFDSSARHGSGPAKLNLAHVFPGFKEALMMMRVGSHYEFVIPSDLAYGAEPKNGFPPNETLVFDVTLVKIGD